MGKEVAVLDHAIFTIDSTEFSKMATETEKQETKDDDMTISEVMATLKAIVPQVQALTSFMDKLKPVEEAEHGTNLDEKEAQVEKVGDADEEKEEAKDSDEEKEEGKDADEETEAKDADEEKEKGMDSADVSRMIRESNIRLLKEVSARDTLAKKLSVHIGAFDCSEMTLAETAKYGMKKIGLDAPQGHELTAIKSYLAAKEPKRAVEFASDSKSASVIRQYLNK